MNNPFDYIPSEDCNQAFRLLTARIEELKKKPDPEIINFCTELDDGKMLGVLIAEDDAGERHTLYAFSGQIGNAGFLFPGFVGPIFDYLQPDGYFKRKESEISLLNKKISSLERGEYSSAKNSFDIAKTNALASVADFKEKCRLSKSERDSRRSKGTLDEEELKAMIKQSQFEKAELHRLKKNLNSKLAPLQSHLEEIKSRLMEMKSRRHDASENLQQWLFSNFRLHNARGESRSLSEIFSSTSFGIPPTGAGECCAPKLLEEAYRNGWQPLEIAEYWYGRPIDGEVRRHGEHYPACRGRCLPVLRWMLQGLDVHPSLDTDSHDNSDTLPKIIYENEWFCIIDKPSGMLSVPGKNSSESLQEWLERRYGSDRRVKLAHRLDRDTSGLIVAAFGDLTYKILQRMFATRRVSKTYIAVLEGNYELKGLPRCGRIDLPIGPDWLDRPRQRVDRASGKDAITDYEFISSNEELSRVAFHPLTGRTHQLRLHAASVEGLGMPIAGDPLYGHRLKQDPDRMLLHAHRLEFTFPVDNQTYSFESPVPF